MKTERVATVKKMISIERNPLEQKTINYIKLFL